MSYVKGRLRSVGFALQGLYALWATQPNVRIHAVATICVVAAGWYCQISRTDWLALVLAIALVWVAEALNTGIEWAVDLASPDHHPLAGKAKDVAAAGVLLASMAAIVIGLLVFVPRLF